MPVNVTFEVTVKPEHKDDIVTFMLEILPDTRAYAGCQGLDFLVDKDNPTHVTVWEQWESKPHYEKYLAWRQESGTVNRIGPWLAGPPSIHFYDSVKKYP